jgi:hypothetical protein
MYSMSGCNLQQKWLQRTAVVVAMYSRSGCNVQQECQQRTAGVAAAYSRSVVRLTMLRLFFHFFHVFFFRGIGVLFGVLEVLEFFIPTPPDFWQLASEIKLGKMALNIKTRVDKGRGR